MKQLLRNISDAVLKPLNCRLVPLSVAQPKPGTETRPIGHVDLFLEDIRARGFQCRGLVDVGANNGEWTHMALQIFPQARALMVEPQAEMEASLQRVVAAHPGSRYVLAGAGPKETELVQTIYADPRGSTFMPNADDSLVATGKQRRTKILTIDGMLAGQDFHPDLVKLDVQGFELEALQGANSCFGRTELFICETSLYHFYDAMPITRQIIEFMGSKGYELYDITEFLRRPLDGALGQVDMAFAREGGFLRANGKWAKAAPAM